MHNPTSANSSLATSIVERIENLVLEAEATSKPLEVDPFRDQLFELFVTAEAAGYVEEDADVDLSADGVCHALADRWGLADATRESIEHQARLKPEELSRMRMLWSVMRLWMEWAYAWSRWNEFHGGDQQN